MSEPKENEAQPDPKEPAEPSSPLDSDAKLAEAANEDSADESEAAAEAEAPRAALEAGDKTAPAIPVKKKKRAAEEAGTQTIRDRNERVRAEAAQKRRARRDREQAATRRNLDASEVMDDALARSTHAAAGFLRRHAGVLQWVAIAALAGWIGWEVYSWRTTKSLEKGSHAIFAALADQRGRVASAPPEVDPRTGLTDARPTFGTDEERLKKAAADYQAAANGASTPSGRALAQLGLAGVQYDLGKYAEAKQAYEAVKNSELATADRDAKGRAIEGLGMSLEALGQNDEALKAYKELGNLDVPAFGVLSLYHQARVQKAAKNVDAAKESLKKAGEKLVSMKDQLTAGSYVRHAVLELYESVDPAAAKELAGKISPNLMEQLGGNAAVGGPGGTQLSPEKLQELIRELQKKNPPAPPAAPAAPAGSAP